MPTYFDPSPPARSALYPPQSPRPQKLRQLPSGLRCSRC